MSKEATKLALAPAHLVGLTAFQIAALLAFIDPVYSSIPLSLFVIFHFLAPFIPFVHYFLPTITKGDSTRSVAITFDDGPSDQATTRLLDLLSSKGVSACFFVIGEKVERHPQQIRRILEEGHEIGNHSFSHDPLLMLRTTTGIRKEILDCQNALRALGVRPLAFRAPAGVVGPRLWPVLLKEGFFCLGFNRRGPDFSNRRIKGLASRILKRVSGGDIVLMHDSTPRCGNSIDQWLREAEKVIDGILGRGLRIVPLSKLIGRPVMSVYANPAKPGCVEIFYDGLASKYDEEQEKPGASSVRKAERTAVLQRLPQIIGHGKKVLEIGAGTGRFTFDIAKHCKQVLAIDLSKPMLDILKVKTPDGLNSQIGIMQGHFLDMDDNERFDSICAFSSLEYVPDLQSAFVWAAGRLNEGGNIYFTTARRSFLRLFTQLGNAMRQGIWLHARSRKEIECSLKQAGFVNIEMRIHGLNIPLLGGLLWEVSASVPRQKS